jgi:hypothetical protein
MLSPAWTLGCIPRFPESDDELGDPDNPSDHVKAIAFTAGFHFGYIEQGGTSLYATLAQKVTSLEVLRILLSIGGSEIMHFQTWQDKAGNADSVDRLRPNQQFNGNIYRPDHRAAGDVAGQLDHA